MDDRYRVSVTAVPCQTMSGEGRSSRGEDRDRRRVVAMSSRGSMLVVLALALASVVAGCRTGQDRQRTPEEFVSEFGGDINGYRELASLSDCAFLENQEARGENNLEDTGDREWQGYYEAASQRYDALDCNPE